jgi:hypothetical protein
MTRNFKVALWLLALAAAVIFAGRASADTLTNGVSTGVQSTGTATNAGNAQNLTVYGAEAPSPYTYSNSDGTLTYKSLSAATAPAAFGQNTSLCGAVEAASASVFFANGSKSRPIEMPKCLAIMVGREVGSLPMVEGEKKNTDGSTSKVLVFTPQAVMRLEALCTQFLPIVEAGGYYTCKSTRDAREARRAQALLDGEATPIAARQQRMPWQAGG